MVSKDLLKVPVVRQCTAWETESLCWMRQYKSNIPVAQIALQDQQVSLIQALAHGWSSDTRKSNGAGYTKCLEGKGGINPK